MIQHLSVGRELPIKCRFSTSLFPRPLADIPPTCR
jgi:hypothetical protein